MSQLSGFVSPSEVPQYIWTVGSSIPALVMSPFNLAESVVMAEAPVELVTVGISMRGRVSKVAVLSAQSSPAEFSAKHL